MNFLTTTALKIAGVPDDTVAKIEAALPVTAALIKLVKANQQLIQDAEKLVAQALPLIKQATDEINELLPVTDAIIAFLQKQPVADPVPTAQDRLGAGSA